MILSCIADNDVPVRHIDTSLVLSLLRYIVKGLNSFEIYYTARDIGSDILTAQIAGLLNVEGWSVFGIGKGLADM